jgi:hypothetical protein
LGDDFLAGDRGDVIGKKGKPRDCIIPGGWGSNVKGSMHKGARSHRRRGVGRGERSRSVPWSRLVVQGKFGTGEYRRRQCGVGWLLCEELLGGERG